MLDEPFNGMDPEGIVWMRGFLRHLADQGRAVLVSSHLMSELQDTAEQVVVVGRGRVIADTSVANLVAIASGDRLTVRTSTPEAASRVLTDAGASVTGTGKATGHGDVTGIGDGTLAVRGLPAERVVTVLTASTIPFSEVSPHRATLEEAYLQLTREAVEFRPTATPQTAPRTRAIR
jgi:ABC-2 type transport system ATP-binding protein